jgi:hypothetical protein
MIWLLAYAQAADSSDSSVVKILGGLLILAVSAVLATVPVAIARSRGHLRAQPILVASLVVGLLTAGSVI